MKNKRNPPCTDHLKEIPGYTLKELAEKIGDLHYESLIEFTDELINKIANDGILDGKAGRKKLSMELLLVGFKLREAQIPMKEALKICKPYMEKTK